VVKTGRGGGNKQTGKTKKYEPNTHTVANFLERTPRASSLSSGKATAT